MKNILIFILALFIFSSSQAQDKIRYTQKSPEIETVKAYYKAYSDGDWEAFTTFYSKDAIITHNDSKELSPTELLEGVKYHATYCSEFGITVPDDELERVITDKGEMWVNALGTWEGIVETTGEKISFPVHSTFQFKDGKIVEEHAYYDGNKLGTAVAGINAQNNPPIHFIEMWTATDAWKNLSQKERGEYMAGLAGPIQGLMEQGVEIISWGANEGDTDQRANYDFYAVWSFPNAAIKQGFEKAVEGSGWYKYFEQKNLAGRNVGVEAVMGTLIGM